MSSYLLTLMTYFSWITSRNIYKGRPINKNAHKTKLISLHGSRLSALTFKAFIAYLELYIDIVLSDRRFFAFHFINGDSLRNYCVIAGASKLIYYIL
jgi:hypothetical protein